MRNFCDEITNFTSPRGLYRVWVRADDREGAPLVARWVDTRVKENAQQADDKKVQICEKACFAQGSAEVEIDPALHLAFSGAF